MLSTTFKSRFQPSDGCADGDGDLPGAEVELPVREGHCQVGTKEARLPSHNVSVD